MYITNNQTHSQSNTLGASSESGSIFDPINQALVSGQWYLALMLSTLAGERDENKLTNMIFFARHPERKGRKLDKTEPDFPKLSTEWLEIRNNLIRPFLIKLQSSPQSGNVSPVIQPGNANLDNLRLFASRSTSATVQNALAILKIVCAYYNLPWRVGFTILEHEGGVKKFKHGDGVMQTTKSARNSNLKLIPRPLKLAILGLPVNDSSSENALTSLLHNEFHHRLTVQICAGIQELKKNLDRFNGFVALAYQAYNAGSKWAYYTATKSKHKEKPKGLSPANWERMCLEGATLLHRKPENIRVNMGVWQCDANMPGWFRHVPVFDRKTGVQLIAFKYLRKIITLIRKNKPDIPCNWNTHKKRFQGSGDIEKKYSRDGSMDKLYDPKKLTPLYYKAVQVEITPLMDDGMPLKVENGQLIKKLAAQI
jgi:hypothetical protein